MENGSLYASNPQKYLDLIRENVEFRVRSELENDSNYKLIIAQVILKYKENLFLQM
jgi:predicted NUDIX family phosphoesterase